MLICHINILSKYGKGLLDEALSEKKFQWRDMVVLMVLEKVEGAKPSFLGKFLQSDKANVTKLINRLEKRGLVYKKASQEDGRCKKIFLTEKGQNSLPWLHHAMEKWERAIYSGIDEKTLRFYHLANEKIMSNLLGKEGKV